jgi:hypothetical protein
MAQDFSKLFGGSGDAPTSKGGLPQYNASGTGGPRLADHGVQLPAESAWSAIGKGLQQGGKALGAMAEYSNEVKRQQQELEWQQQQGLNATAVANTMAQYHQAANDYITKKKEEFPLFGDTSKLIPDVESGLEKIYNEHADKLENDDQKRGFLENSHSITLGALNATQANFYDFRNAQLAEQRQGQHAQNAGTLASDPDLRKDPLGKYAMAIQREVISASAMNPVDGHNYLMQSRKELSGTVFASIMMSDLENGTGAQQVLEMLTSPDPAKRQVLDLTPQEQESARAKAISILSTVNDHKTAATYAQLKSLSDGVVGGVLRGELPMADRKGYISQLTWLAENGKTEEQKTFARTQLDVLTFADMASGMDIKNKLAFEANIEKFNPDSDVYAYAGKGDTNAARIVYAALKDQGQYYYKLADRGLNAAGQLQTRAERQEMGLSPELTQQELTNVRLLYQQALTPGASNQDTTKSFIDAYAKYNQAYGRDPQRAVIGLQQLYHDPNTGMNKQRLLALQTGAALNNPALQRELVSFAGTSLADLTADSKYWSTSDKDPLKNPENFKKAIASSQTINAIRFNPTLGVMDEQLNDMVDLATKYGAVLVDRGMRPDKAIEKAISDIIPGKQVGNYLLQTALYDEGRVTGGLNMIQYSAQQSSEAQNPIRAAMFAPRKANGHEIPLLPQWKQNAEDHLRKFAKYGSFYTYTGSPGMAVIPMYPEKSGRMVPLVDANGQKIVVQLKDAEVYRGAIKVDLPDSPGAYSGGFAQ